MNTPNIASLRSGCLRLLAPAALLFAAHAAIAQTASTPATTGETMKLEKFSVTGSRIAPPDFEGALPVTDFSAVEIAKNTAMSVNNFLRFNPTTFGAGNSDEGMANGGNGTANIGLRGLPTLILVNGRRLPTNSLSNGDINNVPLSAVDHIEVLKDGNGAVYGADAVGGVINIITKHKFDGVQVDASYQNTTKNDISRRRYELVMGHTFDRGSIVMGLAYFQQNDLFSRDRDGITNTSDRSFGATSSTPNPGKFTLTPAQALAMFGAVNTGNVTYRVKEAVAKAASPADFRVGNYGTVGGTDRFPFAIYTPTVRPADRYNYWTNADYKLFKDSDAATFYTDVLYMRSISHNGLAPSPASFSSGSSDGNFTIPANYYWNQQVFGAKATNITNWSYRFLDLGPRDNKVTFTEFNLTAGVKGDITDRVSYDVNYHWDRNEQWDEERHGVNRANLLKMLNGTSGLANADLFNPFTNPFDTGKVSNTDTGLRYIDFTPRTLRTTTTRVADAIVNIKPFDLPAGSVEGVIGYEKRWDNFLREPDLAKTNATGSGWNGTSFFESQFIVKSYFSEVVVPLLKDAPLTKALALGAAVRHETYSHFNSKPTIYRFYLRDQINRELTVRLSYSEGFTIPTPAQLDPTEVQSFPTVFMPWIGASDQTNLGVILSGNPNLTPTTSKSYNLGAIWAPKKLKGLEVSFDLYKIKQSNIIVQDPQLYIDAFAAGGGITAGPGGTFIKHNSAPYASLINVDTDGSVTGIPGYIIQVTGVRNENLAALEATALDMDIAYSYQTQSVGMFTWHLQTTHTFKFDIDKIPGALPTSHYAGYFTPNDGISPGTVPKWKGSVSMGWDYRNFFAFAKLNYTGSFKEDPDGGANFTSTVKAWPTVDLQVSYTYPRTNTTLKIGLENAFNKMPPIAVSSFADKYDRSSHNILGSLYSFSLSQKF